MDRRAFCVSSASGILGVAALGASAVRRSSPGPTPAPFAQVVVDARFAAGRAFGAAAARAGSSIARFHGDLTHVWLRHLDPHWTATGAPVAGLTTLAGLFCLEQLAKDHWLRVVVRRPVGAAPDLRASGGSDGLYSSLARRTPVDSNRFGREAAPAAADLVAWVIS